MRRMLQKSTFMIICVAVGIGNSQSLQGASLIEKLKAIDQAFMASYYIRTNTIIPFDRWNAIDTGAATIEVQISGNGERQVYSFTRTRLRAPAYIGPGDRYAFYPPSHDYQEKSSYEMSYIARTEIDIIAHGVSTMREQAGIYEIASFGAMGERRLLAPRYVLYPTEDNGKLRAKVYPSIMTGGRCFSQNLKEELGVDDIGNGLVRLRATGPNFVGRDDGQWMLDVMPELNYLVVQATFFSQGDEGNKVIYSAHTADGTLGEESGLPLWRVCERSWTGIASERRGTETWTLQSYTRIPDTTLFSEVVGIINERKPLSKFADYNVIDNDGRPFYYEVK